MAEKYSANEYVKIIQKPLKEQKGYLMDQIEPCLVEYQNSIKNAKPEE